MSNTIADIMNSPRSKIKRANRHIDELRRRSAPLDRELYEIVSTYEPMTVIHKNPTQYKLSFRPKESIPDAFAVIIGDVIQNLRAAMDHLASGIIRTWGAAPQQKVFFPITTKRENLITHDGLAPIEQALPGSKKLLLEDIRSDGGANELFWSFCAINNDDKHNFLVPTVGVTQLENINVTFSGGSFQDISAGFDARRHYTFLSIHQPITVQNDFKVSVDITFGEGTPFENEPVIPTLTQVSQVVSKALDSYERLIRDTKF